jgi:hypothetical protein
VSPITDLSYFLFTCVSQEDIGDLDDILDTYYLFFTNHLRNLGIDDPDVLYPLGQLSNLLLKICCTDKDEIVDVAVSAHSGNAKICQEGLGMANFIKTECIPLLNIQHI